jgi:hypothetical protein
MFRETNGSFVHYVCRFVDEMKGFFSMCMRFCCHVKEPVRKRRWTVVGIICISRNNCGVDVKLSNHKSSNTEI